MKRAAKGLAKKVARRAATRINSLLVDPEPDPLDTGQLVMGRHTYFQPVLVNYPGPKGNVYIGNFSSIAPDVHIYTGGEHRTDWVAVFGLRIQLDLPGAYEDNNPWSRGDVHIGSDCWITRGVWIRSGIHIGHGAIVGFRSVVLQDIGPYEVWAGNPARLVRKRFTDEQIQELVKIAWWDWPDDLVAERIDDLQGLPVEDFIAKYR